MGCPRANAPAIGPGGGNIAASGDETGLLEALRDLRDERRVEALPQGGDRAVAVVLDSTALDLPAVGHDRVRGAVVLVERHPHAARVQQLDPGPRLAAELQIRVPEPEPTLEPPLQHPLLGVVVLLAEALDVGGR